MVAVSFVKYISIILLIFVTTSLATHKAIVHPELFKGRTDEDTAVLKINEDITLNLEQGNDLHEEFFLRTYRQGVPQHRYYNIEALQEDLYHDKRRLAAVFITEEEGTLKVEGVVGPDLKIKPVVGAERSEEGHIPHLLESIEESDRDRFYGKMPETTPLQVSPRNRGFDETKYKVPYVTPEIFVVVDSYFHAGFNTTAEMMKYLLTTFRVVNLRYLGVKDPKVQLIFRGVEVSTRRQDDEYYAYLSYTAQIDGLKSLYNIVKYVEKKNETYWKYDMVYFLTGLDMVAVEGSRREKSLAGFAFVASACTKSREQLGEDTPYSFRGIRIMAHEVGHTLGCPHDGTYIEGHIKSFRPDSTRCPWENGNIMSYIEEDERSMKFSWCCDYQISQMTWSFDASCLHHNNSKTTKFMLKKWTTKYRLPGDKLSLNMQCRMTYPTLYNTYYLERYGIRRCMAECFVPGHQFHASNSHWPMLLIDGTECDKKNKLVCINGDCRAWKRPRKFTPP
uniref:Peptidase M12B domain-containing protein n=1 Tax=Amblyomma maculatum TaxID=34609 RepID=G3MRQ7_AMBMU